MRRNKKWPSRRSSSRRSSGIVTAAIKKMIGVCLRDSEIVNHARLPNKFDMYTIVMNDNSSKPNFIRHKFKVPE